MWPLIISVILSKTEQKNFRSIILIAPNQPMILVSNVNSPTEHPHPLYHVVMQKAPTMHQETGRHQTPCLLVPGFLQPPEL